MLTYIAIYLAPASICYAPAEEYLRRLGIAKSDDPSERTRLLARLYFWSVVMALGWPFFLTIAFLVWHGKTSRLTS